MKILTRAFALCILAGALAASVVSQQPCNFSSITEYQRYESDGQWVVFIVPAKLKRECLIAFAKKAHADQPGARFEFFDATGPELNQYVLSASHGLDDAYFYPEKWVGKHEVASLYVFSDGHGPSDCEWTLKFGKGADAAIGRGPCRTF